MRVSFVVRLNAEELASGQFIGDVEEVATGHHGALRHVQDLFSFCVGTLKDPLPHPRIAERPNVDDADR